MVKDTLNSVFDNLKERATNPFLGTLVLVWIVKNWDLIYSLFYFDRGVTLDERIGYIEKYFCEKSFILNMIVVIGISLVVLIVTYLLLSLSRLLTDFYDRVVIPNISKWTDNSSVVLKSDYKKLVDEVRNVEERLSKERAIRVAAEHDRDVAEQRLNDFRIENSDSDESFIERNDQETSVRETVSPKVEKIYDNKINIDDKTKTWQNQRYSSPEIEGTVTFDYSNNNGLYKIGEGDFLFELNWSKAGKTSIYILNDPSSIETVAIAKGITDIKSITNASQYDGSSRSRTPTLNEIVVVQNKNGYYAAVKIIDIKNDSRGDANDEVTFEYVIQKNGTGNFSS